MNMEKLQMKKALLDILADSLLPELDRVEKNASTDYRQIGISTTQKRNWKTDELVFDENGDPVYEPEYGYVPKSEEELTDWDKARFAAVEVIRNALEKLI